MSENNSKYLNGLQVWQLRENYGLEEPVIKDLASEIGLHLDWEDFVRVCEEKKVSESNQFRQNEDMLSSIVKALQDNGVNKTDDLFKYNYSTNKNEYGVENVKAFIFGIVLNKKLVSEAKEKEMCFVVTDRTNFYSEAGGQVADIGEIHSKDFVFQVDNVLSSKGYVFHKGTVMNGTIKCGSVAEMRVNKEHRLACSQNHTSTHLLNSYLRSLLSYTAQHSSYVGPSNLRLGFSAKTALTTQQIGDIEENINIAIQQEMKVNRMEMPFYELLDNPKAIVLRGEDYPESVHVVSVINEEKEKIISLEPCCGTHVHNTSDIEKFVIVPSKSHGGSTRCLNAVTGSQASGILKNGEEIESRVKELKKLVDQVAMISEDKLKELLKEVKQVLRECQVKQDAPLITLKKCEQTLLNLKLKLEDMLSLHTSSIEMISETRTDFNKVEPTISSDIVQFLVSKNIPATCDDHKYVWQKEGANNVEAEVITVIRDNKPVDSVDRGLNCQLVLNKTNFYAEEDDQACDIGHIFCKDFVFKVIGVSKVNGFVFHDGYVEEGKVFSNKTVQAMRDEEHHLACSQNHTALHLLNAALKEELPYSHQLFALAGAKDLLLSYSSKVSLSDSQLQSIEKKMNQSIQANLNVVKSQIPVHSCDEFPAYKMGVVKNSKDFVPTISIGKDSEGPALKSNEPCYGTHVCSTADLGSFVITSSKAKNNREKVIRAVTGKQADIVKKEGESYEKKMLELENCITFCLKKENLDYLELWDCLREVKSAKNYHETDLPVLLFRKHQKILTDLSKQLLKLTNDFVQQGFKKVAVEVVKVLKENSDKPYIIYYLESFGDGKKIINYALEKTENKPAMYFAKDGHKSVICSCNVPKHLVQPSFSAALWINPVASFLKGRARTLTKDPELFYSVVCSKTESVDKAIEIARHFIVSNMNFDKS